MIFVEVCFVAKSHRTSAEETNTTISQSEKNANIHFKENLNVRKQIASLIVRTGL